MIGITSPRLGLTARKPRQIADGKAFDKFFDMTSVQGNEVELMKDGSVYDTLREMKKIVRETLRQTKAIARHLKGSSVEATSRNIWNFVYGHIQYRKDNPLREQLRTPIRTWKDRHSGVDCDCYSIFISSILTNLGIRHSFRMAAYKDDFQHVYVVARDGSSEYIIDPVCDRFNYEVPYNKKHDSAMSKVTMMNGPDEQQCTPIIQKLRRYVHRETVLEAGLVPTCLLLDSFGIPYALVDDPETNSTVAVVSTQRGAIKLPTILTPEQAASVITTQPMPAAQPCTCPTDQSDQAPVTEKKFPWWWIAIGAGALWLLTGSDQSEVKSGLSGIGAANKKVLRKSRAAVEFQKRPTPEPTRSGMKRIRI